MTFPLFELKNISVKYSLHGTEFLALKDISLESMPGKTLGIVGESGCGKSTLAKTLLMLEAPISGTRHFLGQNLSLLSSKELRDARRDMQPVFQDPDASLNPRMTIKEQLVEGLVAHKLSQKDQNHIVSELLSLVHLPHTLQDRFPFQVSGGQKQRICIARALSVNPQLIVLDEPLSSLDMSVRSQIIDLLSSIQRTRAIGYLYITHDLATLRNIAHSVAVLYLGTLVEHADVQTLFSNPLHPYTKALISAIPVPDPIKEKTRNRIVLQGDIPSPINPPTGCVFHTRCPMAMPKCKNIAPQLKIINPGQKVACHLYES